MSSNQTTDTGLESAGPLAGVRVMDVSIMAAGPNPRLREVRPSSGSTPLRSRRSLA